MSGPITGLLQRSPRAHRFHIGFVFVVALLLTSRVIPFIWALPSTAGPSFQRSLEEAAAIASGRTTIPTDPAQPHLRSYLLAGPWFVLRHVSGDEAVESSVFSREWVALAVCRLVGSLAWIVLSLQVFYVVKWRTDYRPAMLALVAMTVCPGAFADVAADGLGCLLALIVFNVLLLAMKIRSRGIRRDYVLAAVLTALATGWAYHVLLLLPIMVYAHFRSQNRHDNFFADLEWHGRALTGVVVFAAMAVLVHPQLWGPATTFAVSPSLVALGAVPRVVSLNHCLLNNDLDDQALLLDLPAGPVGLVRSLAQPLGYGALVLTLLVGLRGLFQRDQRPWRPMAIFLYAFVAMRAAAGFPGTGTLLVLAAPCCTLLAVGLLGFVMRHDFSREGTVLLSTALVVVIEAALVVAPPIVHGTYRTTLDQYRWLAQAADGPIERVVCIGVALPGCRRWPGRQPTLDGRLAVLDAWAIGLPETPAALRHDGATHVLWRPDWLEKLATALPTGSTTGDRVRRLLGALSAGTTVLQVPHATGGPCVGPEVRLTKL